MLARADIDGLVNGDTPSKQPARLQGTADRAGVHPGQLGDQEAGPPRGALITWLTRDWLSTSASIPASMLVCICITGR